MSPTDANPQAADDDRDETTDETLDRNTIELLNELRIAGSGILVLLSDYVVGGVAPVVAGVLTLAGRRRAVVRDAADPPLA